MASLLPLLFFLTSVYFGPGISLEIQNLKLLGGKGEYIEMGTGAKYTLSCTYRSGYDEPVAYVTWYLYGRKVYEWTTATDDISVSGVLLSRVDPSPDEEPGSLHFTKPDYLLAGNYTCQVSSSQGSVQKTYFLHVVDVSPMPFETSVQILKDVEEAAATEDNKYIAYDVDSPSSTDMPEISFEDSQCTLVWSFKSPAIFPKPNVTCGYYSFNHDEVVEYLPAGLTMHKFMNGSWQAYFHGTKVQVMNIPVDHRLGCSIKIPGTSYREVIMSEDDFSVDHLIDSGGCPSLELLTMQKGLLMDHGSATVNCRGNILSDNREAPAIVKLSCPYNHNAIFNDGTMESNWWTKLSCYEYDQLWRSYQEGGAEGELINVEELPECDRSIGASNSIQSSKLLLTSLTLLLFVACPLLNH
ncbi:uncharacterized protein [Macrobrachium rosenbergii]|uniref:uncharacterized protein n=1 Tax=Macrobrachium rosenbergii TaxID=79674 RepID=UPI0034D5344B